MLIFARQGQNMQTQRGRLALVQVTFFSLTFFGLFLGARSVLLKEISNDFNISYTGSGLLFLVSIISVIFSNLFAGKLMARYGMRFIFTLGVLLMGVFIFLQSLVSIYLFFLIFAMFVSIFASGETMGGNALISKAFQGDGGKTLSRMHIFYGVGALLSPLLVNLLVSMGLNWREIFRILAILIILPLFNLSFYRVNEHATEYKINIRQLLAAGHQPIARWLAITVMFYVGFEVGISSWLVYSLKDGFAFSDSTAAIYLGIFFGTLALGRFAGSFIKKGKMDQITIPIAIIQFFLLLAGVAFLPQTAILISLSGLTAAVFFPVLIYKVGEYCNEQYAGAITLYLIGTGLGATLFPFLMGILNDIFSIQTGLFIPIVSSFFMFLSLVRVKRIEDLLKI